MGLSNEYTPQVKDYLARMVARPAFKKVQPIGEELSPFK